MRRRLPRLDDMNWTDMGTCFFVLERLEDVRKGQEGGEKMAPGLIDLRADMGQVKARIGIA